MASEQIVLVVVVVVACIKCGCGTVLDQFDTFADTNCPAENIPSGDVAQGRYVTTEQCALLCQTHCGCQAAVFASSGSRDCYLKYRCPAPTTLFGVAHLNRKVLPDQSTRVGGALQAAHAGESVRLAFRWTQRCEHDVSFYVTVSARTTRIYIRSGDDIQRTHWDLDCLGNDIPGESYVPVADQAECHSRCNSKYECQGYVYSYAFTGNGYEANRCWLKFWCDLTTANPLTGVVSNQRTGSGLYADVEFLGDVTSDLDIAGGENVLEALLEFDRVSVRLNNRDINVFLWADYLDQLSGWTFDGAHSKLKSASMDRDAPGMFSKSSDGFEFSSSNVLAASSLVDCARLGITYSKEYKAFNFNRAEKSCKILQNLRGASAPVHGWVAYEQMIETEQLYNSP